MALVTRPVAHSPVAGAAAARATQGASTVASNSRSQIEELSPSVAVAFDDGAYLLPEDFGHELPQKKGALPDEGSGRGRGRGAVPRRTSNETFAALFRLTDFPGTEVEPKPHVRGPKGFGGLLKKAIGVYEHNAKVIHGELIPRGRTVRYAV